MGRYRSRSRSLSPRRSRSPPRRKRYDDPRDRVRDTNRSHRGGRTAGPSGLLVRNISLDANDRHGGHRRRSPPRSPRRRYRSYSRSPSPARRDSSNSFLAKSYVLFSPVFGKKCMYYNSACTTQMLRFFSICLVLTWMSSTYSELPFDLVYSQASYLIRELEVRGGRDDYYSPRRSVSRSPSPRRSISRSLSLRKPISHSPSRRKPISRSPSPRKPTSRSPSLRKPISRSLSPRKEIQRSPSPLPRRPISRSPPRGKHHTVEGRLRSPRQNGRSISRSRSYRNLGLHAIRIGRVFCRKEIPQPIPLVYRESLWLLVCHGSLTLLVIVSFLCGQWPIFQGTPIQKINYFITVGAYDYLLRFATFACGSRARNAIIYVEIFCCDRPNPILQVISSIYILILMEVAQISYLGDNCP
ncbi:hypothetical protein GIB67_034445 [Kingdonia uniflora]|uniref:Uncharacterized protein n=1 Tax=Kingdonia uniflora TaxID=39325 RepID=A0A7J7PB51_9MAGN|nr:hypothetical protein GIB67_034445 [Kingdonia uniflora]